MTTTVKALPIYQRVRAWFKVRKAKADDNIERSEPETLLANTQGWVFGSFLAMIWMMIAYAFMTDQFIQPLASALLMIKGTFEIRFATLTSVFVLFTEVIVIFGIELGRKADHDDIVDVVNDLGEQIDERFAEVEEDFGQSFNSIEKQIEDLTVINQRMDDLTPERKE